jgi:hypothetical protein
MILTWYKNSLFQVHFVNNYYRYDIYVDNDLENNVDMYTRRLIFNPFAKDLYRYDILPRLFFKEKKTPIPWRDSISRLISSTLHRWKLFQLPAMQLRSQRQGDAGHPG